MSVVAGLDGTNYISVADVADEPFPVAYPLPRFEAHKGATLFVGRPNAIVIGIEAENAQHPIAVLVTQSGFCHLPVFYHQCIICKAVTLDGHHAGQTDSAILTSHTVAVFQLRGEQRTYRLTLVIILDITVDVVRGIVVGQQKGRMRSDLVVHIAIVKVFHIPANPQRFALDNVIDFKTKPIRIYVATVGFFHTESDATLRLHLFKLAVTGKAVLLHWIALSVNVQLIVVRLAHHGESTGEWRFQ